MSGVPGRRNGCRNFSGVPNCGAEKFDGPPDSEYGLDLSSLSTGMHEGYKIYVSGLGKKYEDQWDKTQCCAYGCACLTYIVMHSLPSEK